MQIYLNININLSVLKYYYYYHNNCKMSMLRPNQIFEALNSMIPDLWQYYVYLFNCRILLHLLVSNYLVCLWKTILFMAIDNYFWLKTCLQI